MSSKPVELRETCIYRVLENPLFKLAMQHGLVNIMQVSKPYKVIAATEKGKQVSFAILPEIYKAYLCLLKQCNVTTLN